MKLNHLFILFLLIVSTAQAALLRGNFWPNPNFELGENLDDPAGTPQNWRRGGTDPSICQVSTNRVSPTHALAVVDTDNRYGEWYSDLSLAGLAAPGDQLDLRWSELYDIIGSEMRVTIVFLSAGNTLVGVKHFVVRGQSPDFTGDLATSPFTERNETVEVPEGAATLRISLVSGGSLETTGVMIIDDVSVARHPAPVLLPGNLWTNNPTFEEGTNLHLATGTLTHWRRGGSQTNICQVSGANFISPTHSLAVVDSGNGYGEWYSDLPLAGVARAGDSLNLQWFELFNIAAGGEMRVTVLFLSGSGGAVDVKHYVTRGRSAGWSVNTTNSTFVRRNESVVVPEGAATFRVSLVSGGSAETVGVMLIDDFSMVKAAPPLPDLLPGNLWANPAFELGENLDDATNAVVAGWSRGGNDPLIGRLSKEAAVSPTHSLAVVDANPDGYGEWYSDMTLGAATAGGKLLNLQWFELFSITNGEMRLTFVFSDQNNAVVGENHFTSRAASSGWKGAPPGSTFTRRNEQVVVPAGARRLRASLVSGGSAATTGIMLIDNLSLVPETNAPVALFGNFWPNPGFEEGTELDKPTVGVPQGWSRGGSDAAIDQVLSSVFTSSTHALAVVDTNRNGYGEWYQSINLAGKASTGDQVEAQWWEMFNVSEGGEMRLSVYFFNAANSAVAQHHYVAKGQSAGWLGDLNSSFFNKRLERFTVPDNAVRMMVTLTSGGPAETTGLMVIDDLSFAKPPPPPQILSGNFWPNPTFEEGTQLDKPALGAPAGGWNRGGTHIPGVQVMTSRATSPTHALAVVDTKEDAYSEWYVDTPLAGKIDPGARMAVQWFELYDTTGDMRLSFLFRGADNTIVDQKHFVIRGQPETWTGDLQSSPFVKRREEIDIPVNAVRMVINMASGGSLSVMGTYIIDDLSMAVATSEFKITGIVRQANGWQLAWESKPGKNYTVESSPTLRPAQFQPVPGLESVDATGILTSGTDARAGAGSQFYRVRENP